MPHPTPALEGARPLVQDSDRERVLFLAYLFPPVGGSGVQRSLKFVKYLPQAGWDPIVLTVKPISYYLYDRALLNELPRDRVIARTGSLDPLRFSGLLLGDARWEQSPTQVQHSFFSAGSTAVRWYRRLRGYTLFPDAQVGWIPFAVARGWALIERYRPSVIYSPTSPFSSAIAARVLSRLSGLPYVLDLRDGWTDHLSLDIPTRLHHAGQRALERAVVSDASGICGYGDWLAGPFAQRYPEIADRTVEIQNGFDPADIAAATPAARVGSRRRLVFSGSLHDSRRDVFLVLLAALQRLEPELRRSLEVLFVGQAFAGAAGEVERRGLRDTVRFTGYLPHAKALSLLLAADASLLLLHAGDRSSATGMVCEMLGTGRPILGVLEPDGEAARVLRLAGADDWCARPDDPEAIAAALQALVRADFPAPDPNRVAQFSRVRQTEQLAGVLAAARALAAPPVASDRPLARDHSTPRPEMTAKGVRARMRRSPSNVHSRT